MVPSSNVQAIKWYKPAVFQFSKMSAKSQTNLRFYLLSSWGWWWGFFTPRTFTVLFRFGKIDSVFLSVLFLHCLKLFSDVGRPSRNEPRPAEGWGQEADVAGGRLRGLVLQAFAGQVLQDVEAGQDRRKGQKGKLLNAEIIANKHHLSRILF